MKKAYGIISLFIVVVMGLHTLPLLQELNGKRQTLWPIMAWGMYRYAHPSNKKITTAKVDISAETENGNIFNIKPINQPLFFNLLTHNYKRSNNNIPLAYYGYNRLFLKPMLKGNKDAAIKLANLLNQDRQDRITHIQIRINLYQISDRGIEKVDSSLILYNVHR